VKGSRFIVGDEFPILAEAERAVASGSAAGGAGHSADGGPARIGCTFLAPLDPLMWDRAALEPLYDFTYRWEVYTPAAKRRWGYYVLPILFVDRLVGRIEPRIDRKAGLVRILGLTWEAGFDPLDVAGFVPALCDALNAYLAFGGAQAVVQPTVGNRALFKEIASAVPTRREVGQLGRSPVGKHLTDGLSRHPGD
jgi:uncharacterized protein YcaQ